MHTLQAEKYPSDSTHSSPAIPEVVEMSVLLPSAQVADLESEAHRDGLTVGQILRTLVRDFLRRPRGPAG